MCCNTDLGSFRFRDLEFFVKRRLYTANAVDHLMRELRHCILKPRLPASCVLSCVLTGSILPLPG